MTDISVHGTCQQFEAAVETMVSRYFAAEDRIIADLEARLAEHRANIAEREKSL